MSASSTLRPVRDDGPHIPLGVGTAVITPTRPDGAVNMPVYREHLSYLIASGIGFIQPGAASGEVLQLRDAEYRLLLEIALEQAAGSATVVTAHPGRPDTAHTVRLVEYARDLGVSVIWLMAPAFSKPDDHGLLTHYSRAIDAAGGMGVVIYNNTAASGVTLTLDVMETLAWRFPDRIVGVMQADRDAYLETIKRFDGWLPVIPASEADILHAVAVGAPAVITYTGNVIARELVEVFQFGQAGHFAAARAMLLRCAELISTCRAAPPQASLKYVLRSRGWPVGVPRSPVADLAPSVAARVDAALKSLGPLGIPVRPTEEGIPR